MITNKHPPLSKLGETKGKDLDLIFSPTRKLKRKPLPFVSVQIDPPSHILFLVAYAPNLIQDIVYIEVILL